ncbi:MAG: DNA polymerase IV [Chloroflexi bacterium]|nr:MAG: DNA polymerase IV [Chloroflexota bacterium]
MRRILHVDLDAFFVSVEQALNPKLMGKPVVVGGEPSSRGVVASASYEARAYGICAGMPLKKAHRLCPGAIFLQGSFPRYRAASSRFMAILADFTPQLEPVGIDEAYLDLTGFEPVYGPTLETALRIKHRIKSELGITASIGIATSKLVAKVASDLAKPDGLLEVPPGEERLFLAPLPIAKLPCVGPKTERQLHEMGITTIGELASLPAYLLRVSFGALGEVIHRYARGIDERRVEPPQAAKSISRETTFIQDTLDTPFLKAVLRYLSERVGAELRRAGRRARCVTLKVRYADFDSITRSCTLRQSTNCDEAIFSAGVQLLERSLGQRRQLVRLIGIGVSNLTSDERQLSLLDSPIERWERLNRVIDGIRSRYGFIAIQKGQTLSLKEVFPTENGDYMLKTPSLSR